MAIDTSRSTSTPPPPALGCGIAPTGVVHHNVPPAHLYELAVRRQEGQIVAIGTAGPQG